MNNEIKKMLYKQKPVADIISALDEGVTYSTELEDGTTVQFFIPTNELTDFHFDGIEAQLLIRWISGTNIRNRNN